MEKDTLSIHWAWLILAVSMTIGCDKNTEADYETEASVASSESKSASAMPSTAELENMRRHLANMYEPEDVIHTFKAVSGDIVDCVPLQAQSAMRAPNMKDHVIMRRPDTFPGDIDSTAIHGERQRDLALATMFELDGVDENGSRRSCPDQSIPVRRLDLNALSRFNTLTDALSKHPKLSYAPVLAGRSESTDLAPEDDDGEEAPEEGSSAEHQYATTYQNVINMGVQSTLNVWNPYVQQTDEFSISQVWVVRGLGADRETVEAGWQTYRQKYGDWNARFFIFFTSDDYVDDANGCYNLECTAFVQTNKNVIIGGKFDKYSVKDGYQKEIAVSWYKDGPGGHWWLRLDGSWVGYYPRAKFDSAGLRDKASRISFGGEIVDDQTYGDHTHTDMGSGKFANLGFRKAAYQRSVRYIDTNMMYHDATLTPSMTDPSCYDILLYKSPTWGPYFYFGGAGYSSACE